MANTNRKYSVYASETLDRVLSERLAPPGDDGDETGSFRTRSGLISAIADRYRETCRQSMPRLPLNAWLLIFDSLNGCWMMDNAQLAANGLAHGLHDDCALNEKHIGWGVKDWQTLVAEVAALPFAARVAIIDAAERFWSLNVQPVDLGDPRAHPPGECWRAPVRALVGALADDPPADPGARPDVRT